MTLKIPQPLPVSPQEYQKANEDLTRQLINNSFFEFRSDIERIRSQKDKDLSLSMRRHQFLLMGAS